MDYGIANRAGLPDPERAKSVIHTAIDAGIREFDTAQAYGNSEIILGTELSALGVIDQVKIITKGIVELNSKFHAILHDIMECSLNNLGTRRLYGFMLHKEQLLDQWHIGLGGCMRGLLNSGKVQRIGISVYSPQKALQALSIDEVSMIQIPTNVLDRRFEAAGVFREAGCRGKRIYVRSVFLQGLLLMPLENLPPRMAFASPALATLQFLADSAGISRHQLALGYVRDAYPDAKIVFGAETPEQVWGNVDAWLTPLSEGIIEQIRERFKDINPKILNPVRW